MLKMNLCAVFCLVIFINPIISISIKKPCKVDDELCIEELANSVAQDIYAASSASDTDTLEPLFIDVQTGGVASLTYKFINRTITGQKKCRVQKIRINSEYTNVKFQLNCPDFHQVGKYELNGQLLIVPVHGEGQFTMTSGNYLIDLDVDLKKTKGSDNKTYISFKTFKVKYEPLDPLVFNFDNLFNGQKQLSEAIHNFAHEYWKDLADVFQDPIMYPVWEKMFKIINRYLKKIAVEDMIISA